MRRRFWSNKQPSTPDATSRAALTPDSSRLDLAELDLIGFARLRQVSVPAGPTTPAVATAALAELAHAGVRVSNPEALTDAFAAKVGALVTAVRGLRGERGRYAPLFPGFPDKLPRFDDWALRRTLACVRLVDLLLADLDADLDAFGAGAPAQRARRQPLWQFTDAQLRQALDFSALDWWPASSVPQDPAQTGVDRAFQRLLPRDRTVQWIEVTLVSPQALEEGLMAWMAQAFASPASLRADVREQLAALVDHFGVAHIDPATVRFRETRALLLAHLWGGDPTTLVNCGASPDDVLRLFAQLTGGDVSLSEPVRYPRLTRPQRRAVVEALEASASAGRLGEIFRRRGLWLAIARGLHPAEFDAPAVQEAFARLRNSRHDNTSLMSRVERDLAAGRFAGAVDTLAQEAPGALLRQVRRLAWLAHAATAEPERLSRQDSLIVGVRSAVGVAPLRVAYAASAQLADNGATYPRPAFTKVGKQLTVQRPVGHLALPEALRSALGDVLDAGIVQRQAAKGSMTRTRVHVDDRLRSVLLPDALRATAPGLVQAERGTRLALGEAPVVRMFVHWREADEQSDLDLSVMALDDDFDYVGHVSFTSLAEGAMTHSGDVTSAPLGAQEFIDVRLDDARALGWRYLVPSVYRYSGPSFSALPEAWVGWMLRTDTSSDVATFDPATVVNAFPLTGRFGTAVPMMIDVRTSEVLYVDLYRRSRDFASVERDGSALSDLARAVNLRWRIKASVYEVAAGAVVARGGQLVASRDDADVTFGLDDACTFNALAPEALLAELL